MKSSARPSMQDPLSHATHRRRAERRGVSRRGYTMVEVMMALAVLAVGAAGIVAMQSVALGGSLTARNLTNATNANAAWLEQLNVEATLWQSNVSADPNSVTAMTTLQSAGAIPAVGAAPGPWVRLSGKSLEGDDLPAGGGGPPVLTPTATCTHVRLRWIGAPAPGADTPDALRVELRTFFARSGRNIASECALAASAWPTPLDRTASITIDGIARPLDEYSWVFGTGVLLRNGQ